MTEQELHKMISQGEGQHIEFKSSIPSKVTDLAEELCAFANAEGGTVLIGVNDKGDITGIELDNITRSRLQNAISAIQPILPVRMAELRTEANKRVLSLQCDRGPLRPYLVSGHFVVRRGPNSEKLLSQEEIFEFFVACDRIFFDKRICKDFRFPEDFDSAFFKTFCTAAGISMLRGETIPDLLPEENILRNLDLLEGSNGFKSAVVLLFAKDVQRFHSQAITRCLLFKGTNKTHIIDDKTYGGNLVQQYEQAYKYILSKLNLSYIIKGGGPRKEVLEIPETVFKESLINSLCHRDYYEHGAVTHVEIFDDRVVISNPGGLVNSVSKQEFGIKSFSRNPLVFAMFQRMNLVEKVGSGINRMRDEMRSAGLPEPVYSLDGMFTATFYRPVEFADWKSKIQEEVNDTQLAILELINQNQHITIREMAELLQVATRTIERNTARLKDTGLLTRHGSDKDGYYQINMKRQ